MIYEGKAITVKEIEGGIAQLNFDLQGESVNKFNRLTIEELRAATDKLEAQKGLKGLVVTSSKDSFIVGADITEFTDLFAGPEEDLVANNLKANEVFSAIEDLPFPTVTAINGMALGGGFEMCLATDYRVMDKKAKVGLPEVKLGIFPGFGGTVRLSRLVGVDYAVEWICGGTTLIFMTGYSVWNVLIMRKALNAPIRGAEDLLILALVVIVGLSIPLGARTGAHIEIEVLESRMTAWFAKWSMIVVKVMCALLLGFMSWRLWHAGGTASKFGETTQQLLISFEPFYYLLATSVAIYAVVLLLDIWQLLRSGRVMPLRIGGDLS